MIIKTNINNYLILRQSILHIVNYFPKLRYWIRMQNLEYIPKNEYKNNVKLLGCHLSPRTKKFYVDLKTAIKQRQKEVR